MKSLSIIFITILLLIIFIAILLIICAIVADSLYFPAPPWKPNAWPFLMIIFPFQTTLELDCYYSVIQLIEILFNYNKINSFNEVNNCLD